ncbi:hypothetical protein B7494_g4663 [Chlorociboria aeruginascens]|nr:hypothetical protein B7494_g4663 [Chlorociboria aeruginascens]
MDLRSIINTDAGDSSRKQAAPVTPVQAHPTQGFREYNHQSQASPGKHLSQDYGAQPGGPYASPTTYQGVYHGRPAAPPAIQSSVSNDIRSPAGSYSAQSPYRQTHSSSMNNNQYPFPPSHQTPESPALHQQFPIPLQHRESFPQPPNLQHHNSQGRGSPTPQPSPVGIPGAPHPFLQHQRSQSTLSNSTPTSAQSQHQYLQDSPVAANHYPPPRQQSHPTTPLGPPLPRRESSGGFNHPTSPYQQRSSLGPFPQYQTSPAPPPPSTSKRLSTTSSAYDSHRTSTSQRSISEREQSLSVSPKTRLPSQPGSDIHSQLENGHLPTKRKLGHREIVMEPQRMDEREEPPHMEQPDVSQMNGDHRGVSTASPSPQPPPKKRVRYSSPPIWARKATGRQNTNGKQSETVVLRASPLTKAETNGHPQMSPAMSQITRESAVKYISDVWEASITGDKPVGEMERQLADFLFVHVVNRSDEGELRHRNIHIEIEAKFGQLIDKLMNTRFRAPVNSECAVADNGHLGFKSSMTEFQHKTLNEFLNKKVAETHPDNPEQQGRKRIKIDYLHRREVDKFYELPSALRASLPAAMQAYLPDRYPVKVRVSHDTKTGEVLAAIIKARVADFNIHLPRSPLDCRISVNFEMKYDGPIDDLTRDETRMPDRKKDRLSYTQSVYQVDLTQVSQNVTINGVDRVGKEHELEVEVDTEMVREMGEKAVNADTKPYLSLVEGFLDNIRVLARTVPLDQ